MSASGAAPEAVNDHYNAGNGFIDNESVMPSGELDMLELAIKATNPDSIEGQAFLRYMYTNKLEAMAETWVTNWAAQQHGQAGMSASKLGPKDLTSMFTILPFDEGAQAREYEVNGMNNAVGAVAIAARRSIQDQTAQTGMMVQDRGNWFVEVQTSGKALNATDIGRVDWSRKGDPEARVPAYVAADDGTPIAKWMYYLSPLQARLAEGLEVDGRLTAENTMFLWEESQRLAVMQTMSEHSQKKNASAKWLPKEARAAITAGRYPNLRLIDGSEKLQSGANNPRGAELTSTAAGTAEWAKIWDEQSLEQLLVALMDFAENHDKEGKPQNGSPKLPSSYTLVCPTLLEAGAEDAILHMDIKISADQAARIFVPDYYRGKRGDKGKQLNEAWTSKHQKLHAPVCNCLGTVQELKLKDLGTGEARKAALPKLKEWAAEKLKEAQNKQTRAESKQTQQNQ